MSKSVEELAEEIFAGMATVCDCDAKGEKHAPNCEIRKAREDALHAAMFGPRESGYYDRIEDDPDYGPLDPGMFDAYGDDNGDDW